MFEKHCEICGMDVKKDGAIKRFGKYFCSAEHADKYTLAKNEQGARESKGGGGCC